MTPKLNIEIVYVTTPSRHAPKFLFTASELPLLDQWLNHQFPGTKLHNMGDWIADEHGRKFAKVASPEDCAYEANRQLKRVDAQADGIGLRGDIFTAPGSHDSTLILSDGTTTIEGNAAEIVRALEALPDQAGWQAAWDALADFPVTCDCGCCGMWYCKETNQFAEQHEPSEAELEHWQDMCHEQYTGA